MISSAAHCGKERSGGGRSGTRARRRGSEGRREEEGAAMSSAEKSVGTHARRSDLSSRWRVGTGRATLADRGV